MAFVFAFVICGIGGFLGLLVLVVVGICLCRRWLGLLDGFLGCVLVMLWGSMGILFYDRRNWGFALY